MVMPDFLSLPPELPCGEWGLILQRISTMTRHIAGWYGVWGILTDPCNPYRGWGVQWNENSGRCGICGDPWDDFPREHEAPLGKTNMSLCRFYNFFSGKFATGTIVRNYEPGSWIPVIVDITTNHGGYFIFKLCPNNDITQDPNQRCFDQHILEVEREKFLRELNSVF